ALPEITKRIEELIQNTPEVADAEGGSIEEFDARPAYLDDLKTKVRFDELTNANGKYAYDALWGTG
ncbi:MAG TPA: hypothetical protein VJL58_04410, partial [Pyrinomonadaceae bacterium]|nr:hypothetical protein [Pyrinomonadaceae bacterium]